MRYPGGPSIDCSFWRQKKQDPFQLFSDIGHALDNLGFKRLDAAYASRISIENDHYVQRLPAQDVVDAESTPSEVYFSGIRGSKRRYVLLRYSMLHKDVTGVDPRPVRIQIDGSTWFAMGSWWRNWYWRRVEELFLAVCDRVAPAYGALAIEGAIPTPNTADLLDDQTYTHFKDSCYIADDVSPIGVSPVLDRLPIRTKNGWFYRLPEEATIETNERFAGQFAELIRERYSRPLQ